MAQQFFKVRRSFTSYGYVFVKADDADQAQEFAEQNIDGGDFKSEDDYLTGHSEVTSCEPVSEDEVEEGYSYSADSEDEE